MITDIQKASLIKRLSAGLLDLIIVLIFATGFAFVISAVTNYDKHADALETKYAYYEETFGIQISITEEEYNQLSEEKKANYDKAFSEMNSDSDLLYEYNISRSIIQLSIYISILVATLVNEFLFPLIFKNGETIGKKVFSIGVIKNNGVKASNFQLLARALLGKYAIETMIPVSIIMMLLFDQLGGFGTIALLILATLIIVQIILVFGTKTRTPIHDILCYTVVVDMKTQMIFNSEEEMIKYKEQVNLEYVNRLKSY